MPGKRLGFFKKSIKQDYDIPVGTSVPATPAVITISSTGPQASDGDVPLAYTIDRNDSTVEAVIFAAAQADPAASDFNGGGAPTYVDQGTVALTTSGSPIDLTITGTFNGSVKLALLPTGGGDSDVVVSSAFTLDTTAPVLSADSFSTGSGSGEVDWAFTPNENSAAVTGYRVSIFADGSTPSDAAIKDGTGAIATTTGTASASVAESGTLTGVASTIYVPTIYYIDAFGNEIFQTYADVTAGTGASPLAYRSSTSASTASTQSITINVPAGVVDGDLLILTATIRSTENLDTPTGWTLVRNDAHSAGSATSPRIVTWQKTASSEPASYTIDVTSAGFIPKSAIMMAFSDPNGLGNTAHTDNAGGFNTSEDTPTITATADSIVLSIWACEIAITIDAAITEAANESANSPDLAVGYESVSAGTTTARTATCSTSKKWAAQTIELLE